MAQAQQNQPRPGSEPAPERDHLGPRVPVKLLIFGQERQMPGGHLGSTMEDGREGMPSAKRHVIDYLPKLQMYMIDYVPPVGHEKDREVRMVPREWASFVPR